MARSALILCGGRSSRMGTDKALLPVRGRPLLAHVIDNLRPLFDDLVLAVGPTLRYTEFGVPAVLDVLTDVGPLAGLHAGLKAAAGDPVFVTACDMPFVRPALVERLLSLADGCDAVVPRVAGEYEPMLAVYRKRCVPAIEAALAAGRRRMIGWFDHMSICSPDESALREPDPELLSLRNLNTPADFDAVRGRLEESSARSAGG